MTSPRTTASYTVIYDGDCAVCRRFIGFVRLRDRDGLLELAAYQEKGVPERFPWIGTARFREALQLVGPGPARGDPGNAWGAPTGNDGAFGATRRETWEGARAIEELVRVLPRGPRLGWIFRLPLVRPFLAWGYRKFARNRRRFGCGAHCSVDGA